jgi:glycogen debranching enzyme
MQPPVLAQAVERVVDASGDAAFRDETLPGLERYYRWLARERDPDGDALISIIAQFESGLDYSPAYDPPVGADGRGPVEILFRTRWPELENKLRRFDLPRIFRHGRHQEDVLVNAVYAQGLASLGRLSASAGKGELARWAAARSAAVTEALLERAYDEEAGLFWNLAGPDERPSRVRTIISLMPLILERLPREVIGRLVGHLTDPRTFATPYQVPSVARSEPSFVPGIRFRGHRLIWRGPLSMNTNWFLVHGLRLHGEHDLAALIAARSHELVERGGFNEFYNPLTGKPVGAHEFGWASLVTDM